MRLLVISVSLALLTGCSDALAPTTEDEGSAAVIAEWSDQTSCISDTDCSTVEYGCGGGHTMCTSDPARYEGAISTCDVVEDHPATLGYTCGCAASQCAWKK